MNVNTKNVSERADTATSVPLEVYLALVERAVNLDADEATVERHEGTVAKVGGFLKNLVIRIETDLIVVGLVCDRTTTLSLTTVSKTGLMATVANQRSIINELVATGGAVGQWVARCDLAARKFNNTGRRQLYVNPELRRLVHLDELRLLSTDAGVAYPAVLNLTWFNIVVHSHRPNASYDELAVLAMDARRRLTGQPLATFDEVIDLVERTTKLVVMHRDDEFVVFNVKSGRLRCIVLASINGQPTFIELKVNNAPTNDLMILTGEIEVQWSAADAERSARLERRLNIVDVLTN